MKITICLVIMFMLFIIVGMAKYTSTKESSMSICLRHAERQITQRKIDEYKEIVCDHLPKE